MAYKAACIPIARQVGAEFSAASHRRGQSYASAKLYRAMGLGFKAKQLEQQADKEFNATRERLLQMMEVNGCL